MYVHTIGVPLHSLCVFWNGCHWMGRWTPWPSLKKQQREFPSTVVGLITWTQPCQVVPQVSVPHISRKFPSAQNRVVDLRNPAGADRSSRSSRTGRGVETRRPRHVAQSEFDHVVGAKRVGPTGLRGSWHAPLAGGIVGVWSDVSIVMFGCVGSPPG